MVPIKIVFLPISKLHSILAVTNLLEHNLWLCYYGQVNTFRSTIYFAINGALTLSLPIVLLSTVLRSIKFSFGRDGVPRYLWATLLWGVSRIGNNYCRTNAKVYEKKTITAAKGLSYYTSIACMLIGTTKIGCTKIVNTIALQLTPGQSEDNSAISVSLAVNMVHVSKNISISCCKCHAKCVYHAAIMKCFRKVIVIIVCGQCY